MTFDVKVTADGGMSYSISWSHSRPNPTAIFAVYAIPQGVAVGDLRLAGMGVPWNPAPLPNCIPVLISSDSTGMFGHTCPECSGYWRTQSDGTICPYCALQVTERHQFLTAAQRRYVFEYCAVLNRALAAGKPGQHVIDMDAVADAAGKEQPQPAFYYAEERQQNLFACSACGARSDVLGTFAYCCACGTRNDLQELERSLTDLRVRINLGGPYEAYIKEAVASFDSLAGQYAKQLLAHVPLTPTRRGRLTNTSFHNLTHVQQLFIDLFGIDVLAGLDPKDVQFITRQFHRRHVYEHGGGEADEKYIADSGDPVRLKQALRESQETAHRTATLVARLGSNLHKGFHELFPPLDDPIRLAAERHRA